MGICMDLESEIYNGMLGGSSLYEISISDVLNDLSFGRGWSKNIEYF